MKVSLTNIILVILLLAAAGLSFIFYTDLREVKEVIAKYEDIEELNIRSEQFIKDFVRGNYKEYLTGAELTKYESVKEETYQHQEVVHGIEEIKIKQLFTKTLEDNDEKAESYAIVEIRYETGHSESYADDFFQTLTLKTNWKKVSEDWKINQLEVSLLGDSRDEVLRKQAQEALQNS